MYIHLKLYSRIYREEKEVTSLKDYIKKFDFFKIFDKDKKVCNCYCFWSYGYCKHSLYLREDIPMEEESQEIIMLDQLGRKKPHSRPKLNLKPSTQ